jgi:hypothetical protein
MFSPWLSVIISIFFFVFVLSFAYFYNTGKIKGIGDDGEDNEQNAIITLLFKIFKSSQQYHAGTPSSPSSSPSASNKRKKKGNTTKKQSYNPDITFMKQLSLYQTLGVNG